MSHTDEDDKRLVCNILKEAGLEAEEIPEAKTKRCDLRAKASDQEHYLFEVKGFHDDERIATTLRDGAAYENSLSYDARNTVESAIHEAVKQLESTARKDTDQLRVVVLLVRSKNDHDVVLQQILGTLYGKRSVVVNSVRPGKANHLECLYFSESAFFRYRAALDGAIVIDGEDGAFLCLNDHGNHIARVRESSLGRFFARKQAMNDAAALERSGFLIADCGIDRKYEAEVLQFVAQKYKLDGAILMEFKRHLAMVRVT